MAFVHEVTVRFFEIDRAGIVFFARYYEYCHEAFEELLAAMLGHPEEAFRSLGYGMPLVRSEAEYHRPTRMGDRLTVALDVERVGAASVTFRYRIRCGDEPRATCRLTHCFVDLESFRPIEVPAEFIARLERFGLRAEAESEPAETGR